MTRHISLLMTDVDAAPVDDRPPGAVAENALWDACTGCGDCVEVCPAGLIALDAAGLPVLQAPSGCASCGLCADVCMHGAIELTPSTRIGLAMVTRLERFVG